MAATGVHAFDNTALESMHWLQEIHESCHLENKKDAFRALRVVLRALRDRLNVDEAAELGAQLPLLVRGFYFEGWAPADKPIKTRRQKEFIDLVARELACDARNALNVTRGVFRVLRNHMSAGELLDVSDNLPASLQKIWPSQ